MPPAALVMAKAPIAGRVKTRLGFAPEVCVELQRRLLARTVAWAARVGTAYVALDPLVEGAVEHPEARVFEQEGEGLGERLTRAVARVPERPLLVVGVDTRLTPAHAEQALAQLVDADVVFGPALDGGYYLVGLARDGADAVFAIDPGAWSGPRVLELSRAAVRAAGLSFALIDEARDLDTPEDAAAMLDDPDVGDVLRAALRA